MRYLLHPAIQFLDPAALLEMNGSHNIAHRDWQQALEGNLFAVRHQRRDHLMLVPPAIRHFLSAFSEENTLESVIENFSREANCRPSEIEPIVKNFLDDMLNRAFIVPAEAFKKWQKEVDEALPDGRREVFAEGDFFEGWQILKSLSDKRGLSVYLAQNPENGERRILKTKFVFPNDSEKFRQKEKGKFMQEFALMSELRAHPGVCRYLSSGETGRGFFAWLEFIDGKTPRHFSRENTPTLPEKLQIVWQMLDLIAHCHRSGILHGDIHLSNFLIQNDKKVRLIDFDLANHAQIRRGERQHAGGVQEYMAPEKTSLNSFDFVGAPADFRSEVWQLGVCAFAFLHGGNYPFSGFTWQDLAQNIRQTEPFFLMKPCPSS